MTTIDLNARRAARIARTGPPPTLTVGESTFTLAREIPIDTIEHLMAGHVHAAIASVLADPSDLAALLEHRLTIVDFVDIVETVYGVALPQSSAPSTS